MFDITRNRIVLCGFLFAFSTMQSMFTVATISAKKYLKTAHISPKTHKRNFWGGCYTGPFKYECAHTEEIDKNFDEIFVIRISFLKDQI
jgi:hypothetical protein